MSSPCVHSTNPEIVENIANICDTIVDVLEQTSSSDMQSK